MANSNIGARVASYLMHRFPETIRAADRRERGAALAEYGMLLFFVGMAAFGILALFGGELLELFTQAESDFDAIDGPPAAD